MNVCLVNLLCLLLFQLEGWEMGDMAAMLPGEKGD